MSDPQRRAPSEGHSNGDQNLSANHDTRDPAYDAHQEPVEQSEQSLLPSKGEHNFQKTYILSTHDKSYSHCLLLNNTIIPPEIVQAGTLMQITPLQPRSAHPLHHEASKADHSSSYIFYAKFAASEIVSKQPNFQVSIPQQIASALHIARSSLVSLSLVDESACWASHVELVFRDQYLTRADMWRLINDRLAGRCVYRGQSIEFLGTIKAVVRTIFINGKRVNSGLFHASTKPIFRSESARYVLFIQMSKEMWDFDAEGTGEIVFDKVVNGFLPELFKRWQQMQVRHLVSIVLFTRIEYRAGLKSQSTGVLADQRRSEEPRDAGIRDYYRVVVSDTASVESAVILDRLKKEFQVFLRDTTTRKPTFGDYAPLASGLSAASAALPDQVISGQPCPAVCGNVLEAINLASSQFSSDYIDRDLVRTGVSIVIISPGTGLFEVDYNLLVATTDSLTNNGVGIDLVCLSRMPLHSVPLFKYRQPTEQKPGNSQPEDSRADNTPTRSFSNTMSYETPSISSSLSNKSAGQEGSVALQWKYGIPHWVDISFWINTDEELSSAQPIHAPVKRNKTAFEVPKHKSFKSRVRMYELQMMGVMENTISDISVPILPYPLQSAPISAETYVGGRLPRLTGSFKENSPLSSLSCRNAASGMQAPKLSASPSFNDLGQLRENEAFLRWMDEYDDMLFRHPEIVNARSGKAKRRSQANKPSKHYGRGNNSGNTSDIQARQTTVHHASKMNGFTPETATGDNHNMSLVSSKEKPVPKPSSASRKISFGPWGLGVGAPKAAAAVADTNPVSRHISTAQYQKRPSSQRSDTSQDLSDSASTPERSSQQISVGKARRSIDVSQEESRSSDDFGRQASRPIPIRKSPAAPMAKKSRELKPREIDRDGPRDRVAALKDVRVRKDIAIPNDVTKPFGPDLPTLSPSSSMAPWLTILNPCNPSKKLITSSNRLGRWHHIFPRPPKTSQIKWKSLCSPAVVPLTTEDFPSAEQFIEEYGEKSYLVSLPEEPDLADYPRSLVNELLAFRLARGFQIIIGDRVADATGSFHLRTLNVYNSKVLAQPGSSLLLSRGCCLHRLTRAGPDRIEIKIHLHHTNVTVDSYAEDTRVFYTPFIRSMLADEYEQQEIAMVPQRGIFDWEMIDSSIANHERPRAAQYIEKIEPWRARFVLVPVDAPAFSRRRNKSNEDTEEEVRLEGIQKLTQIWQRSSYMVPGHRRFATSSRSEEDANPLEVKFYTKDPSAVVAEELENAASADAASMPGKLLPETDLYQRSTLDMKSLATKIQSDKGVRLVDRRWHWKLHHYCFIGSELTTWLLENFRDVRNRQEAVDLGNAWMKDGLFKHVEGRHEFRDGHYFYQMGDDYRVPRPESKGIFGWSKASVPPTPMRDSPPPEPKTTSRSYASSEVEATSDGKTSKPPEKEQRPSIALGKSLIYDLDDRHKKSYREELVNLHYDRLHNPDNCYHIRLEWTNTTPKLIQDAIVNWARTVETHGLRLVEVPIDEASSITSMHPFRAPYLIKLIQIPPAKQPIIYFDTKGFTLQTKPVEKNFYQKALLRRFNFVLDFEAASDFPPEVNVTYSWGKPEYRFSQYVHRSGLVLAQITNDGHFLLLANRLYNNRSASARIRMSDNYTERDSDRNPLIWRSSALRSGDVLTQRASPWPSPFSSPAVRATLDVPNASASMSHIPLHNASRWQQMLHNNQSTSSYTDPEKLTRDFRDFCNDSEALETFYAEQLSKASSTGPSTPIMTANSRPNERMDPPWEENRIPNLTLPGSFTNRGDRPSNE